MMKLTVAFFVVCIAAAIAQDTAPAEETATNGTAVPVEVALISQVQQEQAMSRAYIETMLKLQHSQLSIQAAGLWSDVLVRSSAVDRQGAEEDSESESSSDEDYKTGNSNFEGGFYPNAQNSGVPQWFGGAAEQDAGVDSVYKGKLLGAYQLFSSIKMKFYQTVFKSADVQNEFWQDRAMQLYIQSAGEAAPPQLLQLLFVKMYRTNLETLKLSLAFQYLSHFTTWLEDELDVNGSALENNASIQQLIEADQEDDLIRDRLYAFSAYNSYAQIDFQTFYFDIYLESVMGGGSLGGSMGSGSMGAAAQGSSYLEEESTAMPFTDILATGSFGAGVSTNPILFLKVYRFYFLLFQMYAAHSGLTSAYADQASYQMLTDGQDFNDDKGTDFKKFGFQMLYGGFTSNLRYSAQLEYISSLFELYLLFAPALAGSFGSSLGSMGSL